MTFLGDTFQNISNGIYGLTGFATPDLGLIGQQGGSSIAPNHTVSAADTLSNWGGGGNGTPALGNAADTGTQSATSNNLGPNTTGVAGPSLSQYDQAIGTYNNAIGRLGSQLGVAQGNINTQYGQNLNQLNSTKDQSQNSYNTSTTQNGQALNANRNTIDNQASSGLRGLLRTLGSYGAGGSSDAIYNAPQAVAQQASQQMAGAGQNFAQNQQGLDTNWNNFLSQDQNSRKQLNDWQSQQLNSAQASSDTTKQSLLQALAGLQGQRAQAAGGSYSASAQPYIDQAQGLNSTIDNLGRLNPTYDGKTPTYTASPLSQYTAQAVGTSASPNQTNGSVSPYLAQLLGLDKNKANGGIY